jgi:phosphoribosyl 1,2-cyclic phosphate phosphodiesterase
MTINLKVTILGSGTSTGVPVIGCDCSICHSESSLNHRTRASLMITTPHGEHLVIDTGPDFRCHMLRHGIRRLEHVLYTHTHADHCHGFDDLRAFYFHQRKPVHCYLHKSHIADFKTRFSYAFDPRPTPNSRPQVLTHSFGEEPIQIHFSDFVLEIESVLLPHGLGQTAAFRMGSFIYATDFKNVPENIKKRWRHHITTMVASGVRFQPHPTHSSVPETIALFQDLEVKQGVITHLGHEIDYHRDSVSLPSGVLLAYDGMTIDVKL